LLVFFWDTVYLWLSSGTVMNLFLWSFQPCSTDLCGDHRGSTAAASDIHQQVPMYMADIHCDWLTNQNTDWCFVVIGLVGRQSRSPLLQLKIDPVRQMCLPSLLASSEGQRIFINICGQYGIQKNIYIHPWWRQMSWQSITQSCSVLLVVVRLQWVKARLNWLCSCCRNVLLMVNGSVSRTFTL